MRDTTEERIWMLVLLLLAVSGAAIVLWFGGAMP
jgi:hypothetical protein